MKSEIRGCLKLLFLAVGLAACSGPMVETRKDSTVSFALLRRYAWQSEAGHMTPGLPNDPTRDMRIRSDVDTVLQAKGFKSVPQSEADLLLDYQASAEEKPEATHVENYDRAAFMGLTYTLGRLDLSMRRPGSPTVVWQGSVHARVDMSRPLAERDAKLNKAIQTLLKKFPPTP